MKRTKKIGYSPFLATKGKSESAVVAAAAYHELAIQPDAVARIRCGLAEARKGAGRPVDEVFHELEREDAD